MIMPFLLEKYVGNQDAVLTHLMGLDWLEATEARKEYFMSDTPRSYTYGREPGQRTYHSSPYTPEIEEIRSMLNVAGSSFNVCFLNRYDNQKNQLGWHADDSPEMDHHHPIAVISFGAEREIWVKPKEFKGEIPPEWRFKLPNGSLFIMPAGFQAGHLHKIPRCDHKCGVRISLTFRRYVD